MKSYLLAATAALVTAAPAMAQQLTDAKIAVVDTDRIFSDCTACKSANTQLQAQQTQIRNSLQAQGAPLQTEAQSLQTAVNALNGKQPDAALTTRINAFQAKQQAFQAQEQTQSQTFQRNVQYVRQQIGVKLGPIIQQIAQQRGATIAVDKNGTLYSAATVDITDGVLAKLNSQLPSVSVTAPAESAAAATQQRPQSR